jgi:peptidoglycan/xylan/chitin deacetylase (PgdA/CDA1 family)
LADNEVLVAVTIDVDADSILAGQGARLSSLSRTSEAQFGVRRGLGRLTRILSEREIPATFFVPGFVADEYRSALGDIADGGHEIGHHGYFHKDCSALPIEEQRVEFEKGMEALARTFSVYPSGYRAPFFELTPATLECMTNAGLEYDSSCMGDEEPYFEGANGLSILELPVHWILDDGVYYAWNSYGSGVRGSAALWDAWLGEYQAVRTEGGFINLVLHPQWSGRRQASATLSRLLDHLYAADNVRFMTLHNVAAQFRLSADHRQLLATVTEE